MKKLLFTTAIACLAYTAAFSQLKSGFSISSNSDGKITRSTIESNNNGVRLKVEYTGSITLNDSETAIESISEGGIFKYRKNDSRLEAQNKDGVITYQLYDDGQVLDPQSEKGIKFIATVVKELIGLGFDAEKHVARVYKRGGTKAVLAEVAEMKSDYIKRIYVEALLKNNNLTPADMNATAKSIAAIGGNYEKAQVLQKFAGAFLKDPQTVQAYFDAATTISGNYEKSQVLQADLREQLTKTAMEQLLAVAATISGNYEKSQVLQAALNGQLTPTAVQQVLAAAATIGGDYEKAQVLKKATAIQGLGEDGCNKLLTAADGIHSDYEKAGVLSDVINNYSLSSTNFTNLLQVAGRINSAYEKSGVFKNLATKAAWSADQWISMINAAASINAAYEKSGVLVTIAGKMPADAKVHDAYMEAAKTIGSTYEYDQAVKAAK